MIANEKIFLMSIRNVSKDGNARSRDQQSKAYRFLAQYHLKKGHMEDAYNFAQKCTEFVESKAEGKALLKEIARRKRSSSERNPISSNFKF